MLKIAASQRMTRGRGGGGELACRSRISGNSICARLARCLGGRRDDISYRGSISLESHMAGIGRMSRIAG